MVAALAVTRTRRRTSSRLHPFTSTPPFGRESAFTGPDARQDVSRTSQ